MRQTHGYRALIILL